MLWDSVLLVLVFLSHIVTAINLTALLISQPNLSNLTTVLGLYPEIVSALNSGTYATFLAPDNGAWNKLLSSPAGQSAFNDSSLLSALFQYHVLSGTWQTSDFAGSTKFPATDLLPSSGYSNVTGGQVVEAMHDGGSTVFYSGLSSNSTITSANLAYDNGFVHTVDTFLNLPQNLSITLDAFGLTAAVGAFERVSGGAAPSEFTAFIPNNQAFAAIGSYFESLSTSDLAKIVSYHTIPNSVAYSSFFANETLTTETQQTLDITVVGEYIYVNNARIVIPNLLIDNGVIHVIDNVLNPSNTSATPDFAAASGVAAFPAAGALEGGATPFTSGIPTPTMSIFLPILPGSSATFSGSSTGPAATISGTPTPQGALSTGAKAGIGVGVAVGASIVISVTFMLLRSRRKAKTVPDRSEQKDKPELHSDELRLETKELETRPYDPPSEMPVNEEPRELPANEIVGSEMDSNKTYLRAGQENRSTSTG